MMLYLRGGPGDGELFGQPPTQALGREVIFAELIDEPVLFGPDAEEPLGRSTVVYHRYRYSGRIRQDGAAIYDHAP